MVKALAQEDLLFIQDKLKSLSTELSHKHVFITGATGFIGSWLLEALLFFNQQNKLNLTVTILTRSKVRFVEKYPHLQNDLALNVIEGDVRDADLAFVNEVDYIIHAATDAREKLNQSDPLLMADTIVEGTKNILNFAKEQKVKNLLFLSSGAVYGKNAKDPKGFKESDNIAPDCNDPRNSYGEAKRYAELLCAIYNKQFAVPYNIARCFAFVGPRLPLDAHFAIGNFINNILNNEDIIISSDGKSLRSYMYAADLVIWLVTILLKAKPRELYNVGSDQAFSIKEIAEKVVEFAESKNQCKILNENNNATIYIPNIDKINNDLDLKIYNEIDESIAKTISWFSN